MSNEVNVKEVKRACDALFAKLDALDDYLVRWQEAIFDELDHLELSDHASDPLKAPSTCRMYGLYHSFVNATVTHRAYVKAVCLCSDSLTMPSDSLCVYVHALFLHLTGFSSADDYWEAGIDTVEL